MQLDYSRILDSLRNSEALKEIISGDVINSETASKLSKDFADLKEFYQTPMGDPCEARVKKAFAATILVAEEKGFLPFKLPDGCPEQVAALIDDVLTRTKVAYKLAEGELDIIEAADMLIDKAVSRLDALVDVAFEKGYAKQGLRVVATTVCGWMKIPAETVVPVVDKIYDVLEPAIKTVVHQGTKLLGKAAKVVARTAVAAYRTVKNKVKNWLNS